MPNKQEPRTTNQLTIKYDSYGKTSANLKKPAPLPEVLNILLNVMYSFMVNQYNHLPEDITEEHRAQIKGDIFDLVNQGCSTILSKFAPEYEMHPEYSAQDMLNAENEAIEAAYSQYADQKPPILPESQED